MAKPNQLLLFHRKKKKAESWMLPNLPFIFRSFHSSLFSFFQKAKLSLFFEFKISH